MSTRQAGLEFHPLTPERWADLETLFGANGACGGCWCMWWRQGNKEHTAGKGESNRLAFRAVVEQGPPPGVLAYAVDATGSYQPVGWCAVAPRTAYPRLSRSMIAKPVDDLPVWTISCLFIQRRYRRQGLSAQLISAAARLAAEYGAPAVEAHPFEPQKETAAAFIWTGTAAAYLKAGFTEVARHSPARPIMRWYPTDAKRKPPRKVNTAAK
jgi:GNAT superfamily N-acetyltransferase